MIEQTQTWTERVDEKAQTRTDRAVLILSKQGPLRDSLRSLLATAPWIGAVHLAENLLSALRIVTLYRPALVLIVDDLPADSVPMILSWIKSEGSPSWTLILADNGEQRRRALALGADEALLKGFPAAKLFQVIERLVARPHQPDGSGLAGANPISNVAPSRTERRGNKQ